MLPKVHVPIYNLTLPHNQKDIKYRPFLRGEQKILAAAAAGGENDEMLDAILQVVGNCIQTSGVDVHDLPSSVVEYLFVQLIARSQGERLPLRVTCNHPSENGTCNHSQIVDFNLFSVEMPVFDPETRSGVVKLSGDYGLKFRPPTFDSVYRVPKDVDSTPVVELIDKKIAESIVGVFDAAASYEFTQDELIEWLNALTYEDSKKIDEYFAHTPTLEHDVKYTCEKCGHERTIKLKGIVDFFAYAAAKAA